MSRWYLISFFVLVLASALVAIEYWRSTDIEPQQTESKEFGTSQVERQLSSEPVETGTGQRDPLISVGLVAGNQPSSEESELWQAMDEVPANAPKIRHDVPEKHLVRLDPDALRNLRQGMRVAIQIPGVGEPLEVAVTNVELLKSGNTSIFGKVDNNQLFDFVATIGVDATYATIGTDVGVFNLRGNRELAWIAPGRAFNHHVDPRIPDFVIPEKPVPTPIGE